MSAYSEIMGQYENQFLVLIFLPLVLVLVFKKLVLRSNGSTLPPSPPRLPVIGNLHQLGRSPHRSLAKLSDKYGPLMLLKLGQSPTVVVSCPETVKEIVKNHDIIFSDRPQMTAASILAFGRRDTAFHYYSKFWREVRKIMTFQLLSVKRVQSFGLVREEEVSAMLESIRRGLGTGEAVNLSSIMISTSNDIVSRCVLGRRYSAELDELLERKVENLVEVSVGDFFPGLEWVDVFRGYIGRLKSTLRAWDEFYSRLIQEHKAMSHSIGSTKEVKCFLDLLLQLDYHSVTNRAGLTHEQYVKSVIQVMLVAGMETTSTVMVWTMAALLRNPRVMRKAQEEIRGVVGNKGRVEADDISGMDYLKCVVKEVLRVYTPAPLLGPRENSEDVEIGGYTIPANSRVLVNSWAINQDPRWWDRPEEFVPERFENSPIDFKSQENFQFTPFGFGRRMCPGMTFGMVNVEYVVANLLYSFDWKLLTSPEELDMAELFGVSLRKKNPIYVIPVHYSP